MKTGLHANTLSADGGAERIVDYYRRSQAKTFKTLEFDRAVFQAIKAASPGCIIIGRPYESEQPLTNDAQERFVNRSVALARQFPEVDYWEGYNEAYSAAGEGIDKFVSMEVRRIEALAAAGAKAIGGCWSCGRPPLPYGLAGNDGGAAWRAAMPMLIALQKHGGALGLHEYDAPYMSRLVGRFQNGDVVPGDIWAPDAAGWLALRYRLVVRYLQSLGVRMFHPVQSPTGLRVFLGETGVDGGVTNRPGGQGGGWGDFRSFPDPVLGRYAAQRYWYAWQVSHDPYVIGMVSFGECSADPTWRSFGMFYDTGEADEIIRLEANLPDGHFAEGGQPVEDLNQATLRVGNGRRVVPVTPGHRLFDVMRGHGYYPTGEEDTLTFGGTQYVVQPAGLEGKPNRVYRVPVGKWDQVAWLDETPRILALWPCGEQESERHGVGLPKGWTIATLYDQVYMLNGKAQVHPGLDINGPGGGDSDLGKPVYAIMDGTVIASRSFDVWGNVVLVQHDGVPGYGTLWSQYAHLQSRAVPVGAKVRMGQQIGAIGKGDGDRYSAHLHFEIRNFPLGADHWPGAGDKSLVDQHADVQAHYLNPRGILGTA